MFLKSLKIESVDGIIRNIVFHPGMNLIVDETESHNSATGNNVGKTTVLRLIDICLGKASRTIYVSPEDNRTVNDSLRDFLTDKKVNVTLTLISDWTQNQRVVTIRRNFLLNSDAIREINGRQVKDSEFVNELQNEIFGTTIPKPTFRQLIGHNIRYTNTATQQTLRYLDGPVTDATYESLYLYMFGCNYENSDLRQITIDKLTAEKNFKKRLEQSKDRNMLASELGIIESEIDNLEKTKSDLKLNPDFEQDMAELSNVKFMITTLSTQLSMCKLRYSILEEARNDMLAQKPDIDTDSLRQIYYQAGKFIPGLHHTFEELIAHHNRMLEKKAEFISADMPALEEKIANLESQIKSARQNERKLNDKLVCSASFADHEKYVSELNKKYQDKGAILEVIGQIDDVENKIRDLCHTLDDIDNYLFATAFQENLQAQLNKFNAYFARISQQLYGEKYGLSFDVVQNSKTGKNLYKFKIAPYDSKIVNFSTGKKQGEITCFDMAYILFADSESIPCLHFCLYDKKELMHGNQLSKISDFISNNNSIQFVASILKDKLPDELNNQQYFVVKLSQNDKLFRF